MATVKKDPVREGTGKTVEQRLVSAGQAHRRATIRATASRDAMYAAIRDARDAKMPMRAVAELAGVSLGLVQQVTTGKDPK